MIFNKTYFQQRREARGLTLREVATASVTPVAEATAQKWEKRPRFQPRPDKIPRIAAVLGCTAAELATYGRNESPTPTLEEAIAALERAVELLKRYAETRKEEAK